MTISITLVHNKTDADNEAQIQALIPLLTTIEEIHDETDENGTVVGQYSTFHQEFKTLGIPHTLKIFQVIPFGVTPPPSRYLINSGGIVEYGVGDEDKVGNHPRFFNWGLKRGTDNGAEVSLYLEDVSKLNVARLRGHLEASLRKPVFVEDTFGKIATMELLKQGGQLKEDRTFSQAVTELKTRIPQGGRV